VDQVVERRGAAEEARMGAYLDLVDERDRASADASRQARTQKLTEYRARQVQNL